MRKILFLLRRAPFPINNGARLRTYNFLQSLYRDFELYLICYKSDNMLSQDIQGYYKKFFRDVFFVPESINSRDDLLFRLSLFFKKIPWEIGFSYSYTYDLQLGNLLKDYDFDIIFARYIWPGQYLLKNYDLIKNKNIKIILDVDDIEPQKNEYAIKLKKFDNYYDRIRVLINNNFYYHFYKKVLRQVDIALVCSERDKNFLLQKKWTKNVRIVPNTIDISQYFLHKSYENGHRILFVGDLSYYPNVDGIVWFVQNIFPRILNHRKQVILDIVGRNPVDKILSLDNKKNIFVYPNVKSVIPFYEKATLLIVPIRIGAGTRIKILEAAACHTPVVSTSVGVEGLDLIPDKHFLLADTEEDFVNACLRCLESQSLRRYLTVNNFYFVKKNYDFNTVKTKILEIFMQV